MLFFLGYPGVKHKSTEHCQSHQSYWGKSSKGVHEVKEKVKERCQSPLFPLQHSLLPGIKSGLTGWSFSSTNILKTFDLKRNVEIATLPAFNPLSMLPFCFVNSEIIPHSFP